MAIECEAKISVRSLDPIRARLGELGACSGGKVFERNWVFDDGNGSLRRREALLRLRTNDGGEGGLLTVKRPAGEGEFKCREELESVVSPASACREQLLALGYRVVWRYEKKRESWLWRDCRLALDECPGLGFFVEIEGRPETIRLACGDLGLDPREHVRDNYMLLWKKHLAASGLAFRDMRFPGAAEGE